MEKYGYVEEEENTSHQSGAVISLLHIVKQLLR